MAPLKNEMKSSLDAIFARHEAANVKQEEAKKAIETNEAEFVRSFMADCEAIMRPAMLSMADYLKGRGYDSEITTAQDGFHATQQRPIEASIKLTIFVDERRSPSNDMPSFSILCDKYKGRVRFHESTMSPRRGGRSVSAGDANLSDVTEELIHGKILKILDAVFR